MSTVLFVPFLDTRQENIYNISVETTDCDCFLQVGTIKDGCLSSRASGMEACMQLSREISRQGVIHTTLQDMYFVVSIAWIFIQAWKIFEDNKKK